VDQFVANSSFVAAGIAEHFGRVASVVAPPVEVERYRHDGEQQDHLVAVARLLPYKRVDRAVTACNELGLPLKVIGDGPDLARLRAMAGPTVEILGWVDEERKVELISTARALLAPQVEDFGIVMVEALAAGVPVVAPREGGALDIVDDGTTGVLYDDGPTGLRRAIEDVGELVIDRSVLRRSAERFTEAVFARRLQEEVADLMAR
jgi:glycosyltransferase involved in cell wall biosynthesis